MFADLESETVADFQNVEGRCSPCAEESVDLHAVTGKNVNIKIKTII